MLDFEHFYPRYGLAVVLSREDLFEDYQSGRLERAELLRATARVLEEDAGALRIHYPGSEEDPVLRYQYLSASEVETSGQKSEDLYYLSPHVITTDRQGRYTIGQVQKTLAAIEEAEEPIGADFDFDIGGSSPKMKRSFAPATSKLNAGSSLTNYNGSSQEEALFSLVTTITKSKPSSWVRYSDGKGANQSLIPGLSVEDMVRFVTVFESLRGGLSGGLTTKRRKGSGRKRPPIYDGNYSYAPQASVFGVVGLMGALGQWNRRAEHSEWTSKTIEALAGAAVYQVSYDSDRFGTYSVGHHVARLSRQTNLPGIVSGLYSPSRTRFYNSDDNDFRAPKRKRFFQVAAQFLRSYTPVHLRQFLSFRVQYASSFSSILKDYYQQMLSEELVESAAAYGAHLNRVAYFIAKDEVENKDTGRSFWEAKSKTLSAMESTINSSRTPANLLARLNTDAGRQSLTDVPPEARLFLKEALQGREMSLKDTRDVVLAFMRVNSYDPDEDGRAAEGQKSGQSSESESSSSSSEEPDKDSMIAEAASSV